jgi:hypothetical protein
VNKAFPKQVVENKGLTKIKKTIQKQIVMGIPKRLENQENK